MNRFNDIKVGDTVIVDSGGRGWRPHFEKVIKVTDTQFTTEGNRRYTKSYGKLIGGGYSHAELATPENVKKAEEQIAALERKAEIEKAKRNEHENVMRQKYACARITDEPTQQVLARIRLQIERAADRIEVITRRLILTMSGTPDLEGFANEMSSILSDERDTRELRNALYLRRELLDLHRNAVEKVSMLARGEQVEVKTPMGDQCANDMDDAAWLVTMMVNERLDRVISQTYDNDRRPSGMTIALGLILREVLDTRWSVEYRVR